jgi:hypothetical protein
MGYTHYWRKPKGLSEDKWAKYLKDVKKLLKGSRGVIQFESDENRCPAINHYVRFNGIEEDGHETFVLCRDESDFDFCKTACKPYDKYVTACLILAKLHFGDEISISSDGDREDWNEGHWLIHEKTDLVTEVLMDGEGDLQVNKFVPKSELDRMREKH